MDKDIEYYLNLHGHNKELIGIDIDGKLLDYISYINELKLKCNSDFVPPMPINRILKEGKSFINKYYRVHKVGYLTDTMVEEKLNDIEIESYDEIPPLYNKCAIKVSPYKLPIEYVFESEFYGALKVASPQIDNIDIINNINVFFEGIKLNNNYNRYLISVYIHEIIHTQLESNKGIIEDIRNKEVLSIFMELLYVYENNKEDYYRILKDRIECILNDFNKIVKATIKNKQNHFKYLINISYLISTIKAFNILNLYINSNNNIKQEIITNIQNIFDNKKTLEEILTKYDITTDSSKDIKIVKSLLKRK